MLTEDVKYHLYGGALQIDEIIEFFNKFALREKRYKSATRSGIIGLDEKVKTENYKLFNLTAENYQNWFYEKNSNERILVYFGTDSPFRNISQYMSFETKQVLQSLHGGYKQAYINCDETENKEICQKFFLQKHYPNLVEYEPLDTVQSHSLEERIKKGKSYPTKSWKELKDQLISKQTAGLPATFCDSINYGSYLKSAFASGRAILYHLYNNPVNY